MEARPSPKFSVRKILVWIALLMAVAFVVVSITELENIAHALQRGNWLFLLLAVGLQLLCLANNALTYRAVYRLVGLQESWRYLLLLSTAFTFVNMIAPSGGVGGVAVFVDSAKQRNQSPARAMVVGILYAIYEYVTLLIIIFAGFVVLIRRHNIRAGEVTAALLLLAATIGFGLLLYIGYRSSERLGNLLQRFSIWVNRVLYRFFHRELINPEQARQLAVDIGEGVATIRESKGKLLRPFIFAMSNKIILMALLTSIFLAFGVNFSAGTIVGGYSMVQLFFYVSPTPAGIGMVESIFPPILAMLQVPLGKGLLVTLLYRGITVWLTFGIGFYSFRKLQALFLARKTQTGSE